MALGDVADEREWAKVGGEGGGGGSERAVEVREGSDAGAGVWRSCPDAAGDWALKPTRVLAPVRLTLVSDGRFLLSGHFLLTSVPSEPLSLLVGTLGPPARTALSVSTAPTLLTQSALPAPCHGCWVSCNPARS